MKTLNYDYRNHCVGLDKSDLCAPLKWSGILLNNRGLTLIELFLVVAIIGILATMAIPAYSNVKELARVSRAVAEVRYLEKSINAFFIDKNRYPTGIAELGADANIKDPWGHSYVYNPTPTYQCMGANINEDYDLYSQGKDNDTDFDADPTTTNKSSDDIIRAWNGSTVEIGKKLQP